MEKLFVEDKGTNEHGSRILNICGLEYIAHDYDWYIDDAIALAEKWQPEERNFDRIVQTRIWIRENFQHAHSIDYTEVNSMKDCKNFIDNVIHSEYQHATDSEMLDIYRRQLEQNKLVFE